MATDLLTSRTGSGLYIPTGSVSRAREDGLVNKCLLCGADFPLDQPEKFGRHVRNCAESHDEEIQAEAERRRRNPLTAISDPERFAHMRRGGN